jgi:hypothetical protein
MAGFEIAYSIVTFAVMLVGMVLWGSVRWLGRPTALVPPHLRDRR